VVVGNITVGGTGKTPLVIELAELLIRTGYRPGIVSRGYRGKARSWPQQVRPDSDPVMVGDEPVLITRRTGCPMAVGPDRVAAGQALIQYHDCDIIISDDGLQHYKLKRNIEIAVIDGTRRFGNGFCLPAGPLREPVKRLHEVDFRFTNGTAANDEILMQYKIMDLVSMNDTVKRCNLSEFKGKQVHAIAGIGNPQRFFDQLRTSGLGVIEHSFPDHHEYLRKDITFNDNLPVIMTEKDAVKCFRYHSENMWYLPVATTLPKNFESQFVDLLESSPKVK
jgi:tetraacyldisaccharide 4'-kinase